MKNFIADVRVRKQDRNGNTYHDVALYDMDGELVASVTKQYGYGSQYIYTTCDMLKNKFGIDLDGRTVREQVIFLEHTY